MACGKLFYGLFFRTNSPFGRNLHIPNNPFNILIVKVYFGTDIYLAVLFVLRSVILSVVWHCDYLLLLLYGTVVNTYAVQSGGCRFESLWGFGFFLKDAHY